MNLGLEMMMCLIGVVVTATELSESPANVSWHDSPLLRSRKRISSSSSAHAKHPKASRVCIEGELEQNFVTARSKVRLDCKPDKMSVSLNFTEPFRGLISIGHERQHTQTGLQQREPLCSLRGDGSVAYVLRLPHNKCLTRFDEKKGHFINSLSVRYHPSLETGEDYSKTLLCKFGLANLSVN